MKRYCMRIFLALGVALGCGGDAGRSGAELEGENLGVAAQALSEPRRWTAASPSTIDLGSATDRFCFLTEVSGNFRGYGEAIEIYVVNGRWVLQGRSQQRQLAATARCVDFAAFQPASDRQVSIPDGWGASAPGVSANLLWPAYSSVCWLSRLSGALNGDSSRVTVVQEWRDWKIYAAQAAFVGVDQGMLGTGMCAYLGDSRRYIPSTNAYGVGAFHWTQSSFRDMRMSAVANSICMLTRVSGHFRGFGERVEIVPVDGYWTLRGVSQQTGVAASAMCVNYGSRPLVPTTADPSVIRSG